MADLISNLAVQVHALNRVLYHLSEEQQAPKAPDIKLFLSAEKYLAALNQYDRKQATYLDHHPARAQARVIVKRRLSLTEQTVSVLWEATKSSTE
jgi:hypothetical protein